MTIAFTLNGKTASAPNASTIIELLNSLSVNPLHVVVEINGEIINKEQFASTALRPDDSIEILRFVGGG